MSGARRIVLTLGLVFIAAMGAFPPWAIAPEGHPSAMTPAGYHFILQPPSPPSYSPTLDALDKAYGGTAYGRRFTRIDYARLLVQWIVVAAMIGVAMLLTPARP